MRKALLLGILCALSFTSSAQAASHKLTVHRAKLEIKRAYVRDTDISPALVTVNGCRRLGSRTVNCRVLERYDMQSDCTTSERWEIHGGIALAAPDMESDSAGDCPDIVTLTPVDGQPTYDPTSAP